MQVHQGHQSFMPNRSTTCMQVFIQCAEKDLALRMSPALVALVNNILPAQFLAVV